MTNEGAEPGDRLAEMDFAAHNAEIGAMWQAYWAGNTYRVPTIVGTNTRYFMLNDAANSAHITFEEYTKSPAVMFDATLRFQRWSRFNILQDGSLGIPDRWYIQPDFQNYYEADWFGCEVQYIPNEVPDTRPIFENCPERVMEHGIPGPFDRVYARALDYFDYYNSRAARETYLGRPITVGPAGAGFSSDGPMTVACNLFGPTFVCTTLASEPERMRRLFDFIVEATIQRIRAWRSLFKMPIPSDGWGIADDSIAMISTSMYKEHLLPHHKRLYDAFATDKGRGTHLCGNSTRHFKTMVDELNIMQFDTGFPIDFGKLRKELGPEVRIQGGPHVELLRTGSTEEIRLEVKRILETGVADSGRFMLREGNNLAPYTPLENTEAMYHAALEFGKRGWTV